MVNGKKCFACNSCLLWKTLPTHCILVDSFTVICLTSPFYGCRIHFVAFILFLMEILLENIVDPDQTSHYVASDLGLHCLPMTLLRVSR